MTKANCSGYACKRPVEAGGRPFCGRCWGLVPVEVKLAFWDHRDAMDRAPDLAPFLGWCWDVLMNFAAMEAYRARSARRERKTLDELTWRYTLDDRGNLVLESKANRAAEETRT